MMQRREGPRQLPLDLAHGEARTRDDLVVTEANEQALALVDRWPQWISPVALLAGPPGSGKSHLAEIWLGESGAVSVPADSITTETVETARCQPILVDNADRADLDQRGLFHLINAVKQSHSYLLMTARSYPSSWDIRIPDLLSRLRAAQIVEISEPDDMLLTGVLMKLFADRQVVVDPHVVQYVTRRMERSLSTARLVVDLLDRAALERKSKITRALAGEVLVELERSHPRQE
ncbi:DnaA regulatory inactivator HdaA [Nitratireductor basaltis]|uniref:Regulatory inactivation of DnaA Hda protein n=1 Tax=Nitratireductor basaltis TaxID=472175 RepID=A0A084UC22_9HYPH|nr:DnaA regulatory inactivator HdaA [Nitratireductor basaltis]KFB10508.1 Regulatory inactivation of DnaA Hda protein [Nitratireductor basaltis]